MNNCLTTHHHRAGLARTRDCLAKGQLTVGFVGGSITDPRPGYTWPEPVIAWLVDRYPAARIVVENAAIGATGSDLAVFRAQRDLIDRGCDLVFIEFAVNDFGTAPAQRARSREGLIRKLLAGTGRDLVLAYTFCQDMYADMAAGLVPASIAEFEALGQHYGIGSVWMGLHALREVERGGMRWYDWLPDGLHPQERGSLSYAQSVQAFLERELTTPTPAAAIRAGPARPAPLNPGHWEGAAVLPLGSIRSTGPWSLRRYPHSGWLDQVLWTTAPGATLAFEFSGRGLALVFDFGTRSAEFRWRIDDGPWQTESRARPDWVGPAGWLRLSLLADDLPAGPHQFAFEVIHGGPACKGTDMALGLVGVIN